MLRYLLIPIGCLICSALLAQDFRVQLAAFADSMPIAYFRDHGVEKVMVSTDQLGMYRYFSGVYTTREQAEKVLETMVAKGFPDAVIIDLEEQRALCSMTCPYNRPGHPVFLEHVGQAVLVKYIFFDSGSFKLSAESNDELELVRQGLKENPKLSLKIIGQTDAIGDPTSNVELATNRARAARNYLINLGIRTDRMLIKVYGEAEAELPNRDEKGNDLPQNRKWNRRVVLALIDPSIQPLDPEE